MRPIGPDQSYKTLQTLHICLQVRILESSWQVPPFPLFPKPWKHAGQPPSSIPALILFTPVLRHQSYPSSGCMTREHSFELCCPSVSLNGSLSSPLPKNPHMYLFSKIHSMARQLPSFPSCPPWQSGNPPRCCKQPGTVWYVSPVAQPSSAHLLSWDQAEQVHLTDSAGEVCKPMVKSVTWSNAGRQQRIYSNKHKPGNMELVWEPATPWLGAGLWGSAEMFSCKISLQCTIPNAKYRGVKMKQAQKGR